MKMTNIYIYILATYLIIHPSIVLSWERIDFKETVSLKSLKINHFCLSLPTTYKNRKTSTESQEIEAEQVGGGFIEF